MSKVKFGSLCSKFIVITSLFCTIPLQAGTVQVVNENKKPLKLKITPEGTDARQEYIIDLAADQYTSFEITSDQLGGKNYYTINGSTSIFSGTCKNLSIDKNYKVTFQNDQVGTTCLADETGEKKG